ncbi:MAG: riboflavin synthase, partial [Sporomusa sp.]
IAIDGTSLTVVNFGSDWFTVSLIPHTAELTTVGLKKAGEQVNLEADVIGKYVEKLLGLKQDAKPDEKITRGFLEQHGFT